MSPDHLTAARPTPSPLARPYPLPLGRAGMSGFPSSAQDYAGHTLDLNEHLVKRPSATFFFSVTGDSMVPLGIHKGNLMLVDCSVDPRLGHTLEAMVEGEITVRYEMLANRPHLSSGDSRYAAISLEELDCQVWGVVRVVIHEYSV